MTNKAFWAALVFAAIALLPGVAGAQGAVKGYDYTNREYHTVAVNAVGQLLIGAAVGVAGDAAHDAADTGNPVKIGFRARNAQIAAVANDDRTDGIANVYGEQVIAGFTWATSSTRIEEIDPISEKHDPATLCALTNIATNTTDYCGYIDMDGYRAVGIQIETSGAVPVDVLTVTLEATIQDDGTAPAACTYQDVTLALAGVASWVDTDAMFLHDTVLPVKYLRVAYVTSNGGGNDADLTVYVKKLY